MNSTNSKRENTDEHAERGSDGRWEKGTPSPNPGGRPKILAEVQMWAREVCEEEGQKQLLTLARKAKSEETRLRAWQVIFGYAYGKPAESVRLTGGDDPPTKVYVNLIPVEARK